MMLVPLGGENVGMAETTPDSGMSSGLVCGTAGTGFSGFGTEDWALKNSSFRPGRNLLILSQVMCHSGR